MRNKEAKRGAQSPQTLKAYIDYKIDFYTDEICEIETRLREKAFEEKELPQINNNLIEYTAKLNVLKSIKIICNERGRY